MLEPVRVQLLREMLHCLRPRIKTNMLLGSREMYDVMALPVGRHRPGNLFRRFRQFILDGFSDALKLISDSFILGFDILINGFRRFSAEMLLILILERAAAFRAFLHRILPSFLNHNVYAVPVAFSQLIPD